MAFNNQIKTFPIHFIRSLISKWPNPDGPLFDSDGNGYENVEHFILGTKSGCILDYQPTKGV